MTDSERSYHAGSYRIEQTEKYVIKKLNELGRSGGNVSKTISIALKKHFLEQENDRDLKDRLKKHLELQEIEITDELKQIRHLLERLNNPEKFASKHQKIEDNEFQSKTDLIQNPEMQRYLKLYHRSLNPPRPEDKEIAETKANVWLKSNIKDICEAMSRELSIQDFKGLYVKWEAREPNEPQETINNNKNKEPRLELKLEPEEPEPVKKDNTGESSKSKFDSMKFLEMANRKDREGDKPSKDQHEFLKQIDNDTSRRLEKEGMSRTKIMKWWIEKNKSKPEKQGDIENPNPSITNPKGGI